MKEPEFYDRFFHLALTRAGLAPMGGPAGVEVAVREGDSHVLLFLLNHTEEAQIVKVPAGQTEALRRVATSRRSRWNSRPTAWP